jgi:hypothetical protein
MNLESRKRGSIRPAEHPQAMRDVAGNCTGSFRFVPSPLTAAELHSAVSMQLNRYVQRGGRRGRREQFGPENIHRLVTCANHFLCALCASAFEISLPFNCIDTVQDDRAVASSNFRSVLISLRLLVRRRSHSLACCVRNGFAFENPVGFPPFIGSHEI